MSASPCSNFGTSNWPSPSGRPLNAVSPRTPPGGRPFDMDRDCYEPEDDHFFQMMQSADARPRRSQQAYLPRNEQLNQSTPEAQLGRRLNPFEDCTPPGRNMGFSQQLNQSTPEAQLGRPLNPFEDCTPPGRNMGFSQQRRQVPSEIKLSSAGRAFNSGTDDLYQSPGADDSGPSGRPLAVHGYVEPGSPQWLSLYMGGNYTYAEGYYSPNDMRNRSPSANRYDCDPSPEQNRNANCDPNAINRNQSFPPQNASCPCPPRGGASPNQMQPWNQTDCAPPRMMPPNYGPSPQYNIRDNTPKRSPAPRDRSWSPSGACCCPPGQSGPSQGAPSNMNIPRTPPNPCCPSSIQSYNPGNSSFNQNAMPLQIPCPPQQQIGIPRPMPQPRPQQQLQQPQGRFDSPDCSPNRVGRTRSNSSFKPSGSGPKATSTPKATASCLSMRELCNRKLRDLQMENLVRDQYTPGVIQETLDGCENFNIISFDLTLGQDAPETKPQVDPLTLVEAFYMRIDYERNQVNCARERSAAGKEPETDPDKIKKNEKKEIEKYFACQNDTELNRAIAGLLRAERIEELTNDEKPLFETEISKKESTLPGSELNNFQDLTMITYTSTTKPA